MQSLLVRNKVLSKRIVATHANKKNSEHSVFQLNNKAPIVSTKDVKEAFEMTQHMTSYQRLRYFRQMGIDYKRSLQYIKMIEQFDETFEASKSMETPQATVDEELMFMTVDIGDVDEDERFPSNSTDEHEHFPSGEEEAFGTHVNNMKDGLKHAWHAPLSITAIFFVMLAIKYIVEQDYIH
jgi:hypothetical protein